MSRKRNPRIKAEEEVSAITVSTASGFTRTSPAVLVNVEFDHEDHESAERLLDEAVASVRAQIADVAGGAYS